MRYACSECYPQWRIDSITDIHVAGLKGVDTKIFYQGNKVEDLLDNELSGCLICYEFYFKGILKSTLNDKYEFHAVKYEYKLKFKGCCE